MAQRIITGSVLICILVLALAMGSWWFSIPLMAFVTMCVVEIYRAFREKGRRPVDWPAYAAVAVSLPVMTVMLGSTAMFLPIVAAAVLAMSVQVIFRKEPALEDLAVSVLPLFFVLFPAMCLMGFFRAQTRDQELYFQIISFGIPLMGDTFAYFVGVLYGRTKLCEPISPKKTVEGAVAGLVGSAGFATVVYMIFRTRIPMPIWHAPLLGLVGGVAGQAGDLFASMIKRHCGIKDFGSIFPGHGGVMDRLDSVFWAAVAVYIYMNWLI